jgi:hypothetical protein
MLVHVHMSAGRIVDGDEVTSIFGDLNGVRCARETRSPDIGSDTEGAKGIHELLCGRKRGVAERGRACGPLAASSCSLLPCLLVRQPPCALDAWYRIVCCSCSVACDRC